MKQTLKIPFLFLMITGQIFFFGCKEQKNSMKPEVSNTQTEKKWRTIIAFNTEFNMEIEGESQRWAFFYDKICYSILNKDIEALHYKSYEKVPIGPVEKPVAIIDLTRYKNYKMGYVFFESGKEPMFQKYDFASEVLKAASEYFEIEITPANMDEIGE